MGISAKVATNKGEPNDAALVICIYTKDMDDIAAVKNVLIELVRIGLVAKSRGILHKDDKASLRQIWYKPDCYTYLDLKSGNEYRIRPTLYGSATLLTEDDLDN